MTKIVINADFGGFNLSEAAVLRYAELAGLTLTIIPGQWGNVYSLVPADQRSHYDEGVFVAASREERITMNQRYINETFYPKGIPRNDPLLVRVVEEMGSAADGPCASLKVIEIPDDVAWVIEDYDGSEHVAETHRTWR